MNLNIEATRVTPYVHLDISENEMTIKGRSSPQHSLMFYDPIIEHIRKISDHLIDKRLTINIQLEYFNTSSAKCIINLFKIFVSMKSKGYDVVVNWYVEDEDEDMRESGEDFEDLTNLYFNYVFVDSVDNNIEEEILSNSSPTATQNNGFLKKTFSFFNR